MRVHRLPLRIHSIRNSALVGNAPLARALALTLAVSRSSCYTCTMARLEYFATRANVIGLSSRIGLASSNPKPSFVLLEGYLNAEINQPSASSFLQLSLHLLFPLFVRLLVVHTGGTQDGTNNKVPRLSPSPRTPPKIRAPPTSYAPIHIGCVRGCSSGARC